MNIAKTINDFKDYLTAIGEETKKLTPQQKEQLNEIIKSMLILFVGFRKGSHLGETFINFTN